MLLASGIILVWSGEIVDIPDGFVICDGENGTPDLRDRFIVGAGDTYVVDKTGGNINHNHTFTGDGHIHDLPAGTFISSGAALKNESRSTAVTGTTDNANGLPPYYALAFIMKT